MSSDITVKILVEVRGIPSPDYPESISFSRTVACGGNPSFLGDAMQTAIKRAADAAVRGVEPLVHLRPS